MTMQLLNGYIPFPTPHFSTSGFSPSNILIDNANEKAAFIFQVAKTGNIRKVHYRVAAYVSTGVVDVRLETVDVSTGMPTGTLIGTNTNAADTPTATGWRVCTLTADAAVVKGDLIAIVVAQPGVANGNISLGYQAGNSTRFPYQALYTGTWSKIVSTQAGLGAVEYSDGSFIHTIGLFPWKTNTITAFSSASSPNHRGLRFSLPAAVRIRGFWLYYDGIASSTITVKLYDSDGATVMQSLTIDIDQTQSTALSVRMFEFAAHVDILPNTYYRLVIAPDTNSINVYENTVHTAALMDAYGIGQTGHLTTAANPTVEASWTQDLLTCPTMGLLISALDDAITISNLLIHPGMSGGMRG